MRLQDFFGATGRTRTGDLLITNQLLYQLSHSSIPGEKTTGAFTRGLFYSIFWQMSRKIAENICRPTGKRFRLKNHIKRQAGTDGPDLPFLSRLQNLAQKILQTGILRMVEHLVGGAGFQDAAVVHKQNAVGHLAGKTHFVGDDDGGHAAF